MRQRYIAIVNLSSSSQKCPLPYASKWPTPHPPRAIARTRRFGGLVAGQGLRWAGHARRQHAALRRARRRRHRRARRRHRARARQAARPDARRGDEGRPGPLDRRLHRDPGVRARGVQGHAREPARRRPAAAVQARSRSCCATSSAMPLEHAFAEFEHEAFAAASIGQVHRATTTDGTRRRGQGPVPGHRRGGRDRPAQPADAVPAGQAPRARARRQGARRRAARADRRRARLRGRGPEPPRDGARLARAPVRLRPAGRHGRSAAAACSSPSCIEGRRFEAVKALADAERDRFGEIVFRFFFGTLKHLRRAAGDPHPGNYLLLDDGRVGFLDFGLMRVVDADYLEGERAARAGRRRAATREAVHAGLDHARLPARARTSSTPERAARPGPDRRRVVPRARLPPPHPGLHRRADRAAAHRRARRTSTQMRRADDPAPGAADPPHGGPGLRHARRRSAPAPTGTRSAREYWGDAPPSTPLGEQDARG